MRHGGQQSEGVEVAHLQPLPQCSKRVGPKHVTLGWEKLRGGLPSADLGEWW